MTTDKDRLGAAITDLKKMVGQAIDDEAVYQKWFEDRLWLFEYLGFRDTIPHPKFIYQTGCDTPRAMEIPDFIFRSLPSNVWEILEIKTPQTSVIKKQERRKTFYATFEEFLSQVADYGDYFLQDVNRKAFNLKYRASMLPRPPIVILAGRSDSFSPREAHMLLANRSHRVELWTYDEVVNALELEYKRLFGRHDGVDGISIHLMVYPCRLGLGRRNHIFDMGFTRGWNQISVFISELEDLCFRVFDNEGREFSARALRGHGGTAYEQFNYIVCELGFGSESTQMSLEVNCAYSAIHDMPYMSLCPSPENLGSAKPAFQFVLGSDVWCEEQTDTRHGYVTVFSRTMQLAERMTFRKNYLETGCCMRDPTPTEHCTHLTGNRFIRFETPYEEFMKNSEFPWRNKGKGQT